MAESQDRSNTMQDGQVPEEKRSEVAGRDEFGEFNAGNTQRPQEQQQFRVEASNVHEQGGNINAPQGAAVANPAQDNQRSGEADQGEQNNSRGGGNDQGVSGNFRGRGGMARGRGGFINGRGPQYGMMSGYGRDQRQHRGSYVGPYGDGMGQHRNPDMGPTLFDMLPRNQNYVSEGRFQGQFSYPTNPVGQFAQTMSRVTCNPTLAEQGTGPVQNLNSRELFEQLQMALSIQLGFNGPQQVRERALHNVMTSATARLDIKQILQSRAELYGDELDPKLFQQNADLGGKASTVKKRNQARAQLAGAPLLVAQLSELELGRSFWREITTCCTTSVWEVRQP